VITDISLSYCGLDKEAGKSIQLLLAFIDTKLETLNLQGNNLGSEGVTLIFKAMVINTSLTDLNISDNKFSDESGTTISYMCDMLEKNVTLFMLDCKYNEIREKAAESIIDTVAKNKKCKVDMTDRFSKSLSDKINLTLKGIKTGKKSKKKGKGGKAKKKK
jgi:Ran GTPase-activating protein (RanGAP) involved in mRNA processing and transport